MKAILVVEIPDNLPIDDVEVRGGVYSNRIDDGWMSEFTVEDLKPMPRLKKFTPLDAYNHNTDMYVFGWNDCLWEIEG